MKDDTNQSEPLFMERHKFLVFIILSVIISLVIVVISMAMYNSSGAAQLDLSRPGYKDIRAQAVDPDGDFKAFSASGKLNKDVISNFVDLYNERTQKIKSVDAFGGDPLSPEALDLAAPSS